MTAAPFPELVHLVVHPHRTWLAGVHLDEEHAPLPRQDQPKESS